jgi:hypothetical protein
MSKELMAYAKADEFLEAAADVLAEAGIFEDDVTDLRGKLRVQLKADLDEGEV